MTMDTYLWIKAALGLAGVTGIVIAATWVVIQAKRDRRRMERVRAQEKE